jgi:hypothetical protein
LIHVRSLKVRKPHFFKFKGTGYFKKINEISENVHGGLAITDKKITPRNTEKTKQLVCSGGIPAFRGTENRTCCLFCVLEQDFFFSLIFFMRFSSVPSLGIDSSIDLGIPWNEHFLPRNNGSHSESYSAEFFRNKIPLPTLGPCLLSFTQRHNTENLKQIFPGKNCPNSSIHVSVSDLYIPLVGLSILL